MEQQTFIDVIKIVVGKVSQSSVEKNLIKPPGRQPHAKQIILSDWYNNLEEHDRNAVLDVVKEAVDMTLFGFLTVLDGVAAIENGPDKGKLNLYYEKDKKIVFLNDPQKEYLHNLL